jgi:cytidyltransferase-like protein
MRVHNLFEDAPRKLVVTYPGRFQPFHKGHRDVFSALQKKFGRDNVWIVTSNKTDPVKSPFNFSDKVRFMHAAGVPDDRIIETDKVYDLPQQFNNLKNQIVFVTVVGAPDAKRLNPGATKKDGTPAYFQNMPSSANEMETADQHGYVIVEPERPEAITIGGQKYDVSHGTPTRALWNQVRRDPQLRAEFIQQLYGRNDADLGHVLDKIAESVMEGTISELRKGQKDANGYTRCWPGKHAEGTKKGKNGGRVRNCVPNEDVSEDAAGVGVVRGGNDPRYMTATMGDDNDVNSKTLGKMMKAYDLIGKKPAAKHQKAVKKNVGTGVKESRGMDISHEQEESPVANAILRRLRIQYMDQVMKYGPDAAIKAADAVAHHVGDVDEMGSSDVSIWTQQALEYMADNYPGQPREMNEAITSMQRARDADLHQNMGNGYWIGSTLHDDGDSRKVSYELYHTDDAAAAENPMADQFANVWRWVGFLNVSPYRATPDEIKAAATQLISTDQLHSKATESRAPSYTPADAFSHGKKSAEVSHKTDKRPVKNPFPAGSRKAEKWQRGYDSYTKAQTEAANPAQQAAIAIAKKKAAGVNEGDVVPFRRPEIATDMPNLQAAKSLAKQIYWTEMSSHWTPEELADEEELHNALKRIGYTAESDQEMDAIVITHMATKRQYRMEEDELLKEGKKPSVKESMTQYDKADPYNSEFAPAGGMGRMSLRGWKQHMAKAMAQLADQLQNATQPNNIDRDQLWNTLLLKMQNQGLSEIAQEIQSAQEELARIRSKGGVSARAFKR